MHSHIKGVLDSFASHLKIRRTEGDVTEVAQKYLALGCNVVPTQHVYDIVSSDYKLLELKTQNPPLCDYAHQKKAPVDPITFTELIKCGYSSKRNTKDVLAEFDHFVESVVLTPVLEQEVPERWIEACRKDKWKDVALFLSLNYKENPKFHTLLKTITDQEDVSTLRKRMLEYKPNNKNALAHDMGKLIKSLSISKEFEEHINNASSSPSSSSLDTTNEPLIETHIMEGVSIESTAEPTQIHPSELKDPIMDSYRRRAGLSPVVDPTRIAKQMVAASFDFKEEHNIPSGLLLRSQSQLTPLASDEERALALQFIHSPLFSSESIQKALKQSRQAPYIAQACNQQKWEGRDLLSYMVDTKAHMDERTFAKWSKMEKQVGETPEFFEELFKN
jgi:hypothetical protein